MEEQQPQEQGQQQDPDQLMAEDSEWDVSSFDSEEAISIEDDTNGEYFSMLFGERAPGRYAGFEQAEEAK